MKCTINLTVPILLMPVFALGAGNAPKSGSSGRDVTVVSTPPAANSHGISVQTTIEIFFSDRMDPAMFDETSFAVYSPISGRRSGTYDVVGATAVFTPDDPFTAGELVSVSITAALASMAGPNLTTSYVFRFMTISCPSAADFIPGDDYPVGHGPPTMCSADFTGDGAPDVAVGVNEIDSVFLFVHDGSSVLLEGLRTDIAGDPVRFTPPVTICIDYDDTEMTEAQEGALQIQHWFAGEWLLCPRDWYDTELNIISATTSAFSMFAVTYPDAYLCGDTGAGGTVDIDDVVYLIGFICSGGLPPEPYESGDAGCSGGVDIDDVVFLIA